MARSVGRHPIQLKIRIQKKLAILETGIADLVAAALA